MIDDASTLAPPPAADKHRVGAIALTIAYHPDISRIGERHVLASTDIEISRVTPEFESPHGGPPRPLGDRYISRSAIAKLSGAGTGISVEATGATPVVIDGKPIAGAMGKAWQKYDRDALAAGLTVELADRIVLVLHLYDGAAHRAPRYGIVGDSDAIEHVRADIGRVVDLQIPVLIRGESGTGKELVARALHDAGPRTRCAFIGVNLAALPPNTAASELFGHARGAFTGATHDHQGLFLRADKGTLFLDEIGETPFDVQPMLLRVLETGEIVPLGSSSARKADVRVIAATDADLETQIAESGFREALFHRLAGFQLLVPPLRERRDDIGRLLVHFLRSELATTGDLGKLENQQDQTVPWLPASLVARLVRHSWPGNVRQLRNAARQLAIASRGSEQIRIDPVIERLLAPTTPAPRVELQAAPRQRRDPTSISDDELLAALRGCSWRAGPAAERLGVSRSTFYVLVDRCPRIRKAKAIPEAELQRSRDENGGDLDAMAAALEVSRRALQLRLSELGWI